LSQENILLAGTPSAWDSGFRIQDSGFSDPKTINLTFNYAASYLNPASCIPYPDFYSSYGL